MKRNRGGNFTFSDFFCTNCGRKTYSLPRAAGAMREPGHLKDLYCIYCKENHNCAEIRQCGKYSYEDFILEFNNGNFDSNGQRKEPYTQFLRKLE